MGDCHYYPEELRLDTRDPELTHAYMFIRAEGDCPFMVHGWHHKAFPSSVTSQEIIQALAEGDDPVTWERQNPAPVLVRSLYGELGHVPVSAARLDTWRKALAGLSSPEFGEIADEITALLTVMPEWHRACPTCRSRDMLERAILEQQG